MIRSDDLDGMSLPKLVELIRQALDEIMLRMMQAAGDDSDFKD